MEKAQKITSTVARSEDAIIQITFNIPFYLIKEAREKVIVEYAKEAEIPGFRKGKAPLDKVKEKIDPQTLLEKSLGQILPKALGDVITEHKIKPALYPKFELIKAEENEDWQIRAVTCELPEVNLSDYKKIIIGASKKEESHSAKASRDEEEQEIIKILLERIKIKIPKLLIDEEVNSRLAGLLEKIEKLGLNLEGYLNSLGKTPETLREEYRLQAQNTISLELILNAIIETEKLKVEESEIDNAIKAASADSKLAEKLNAPEQRRMIKNVLLKRKALDYLASLA